MAGDYREPHGAWTADLQWANDQDARIERLWSRVLSSQDKPAGFGITFEKVADGTAQQRSGCDRIAEYPRWGEEPGRITLEEKVRRMPFTRYGDVLFELRHEHDDGRVRPGWAEQWPSAEMFAWIWLGDENCKCDWILALPTSLVKHHFETVVKPHLDRIPKRYFRESRTNNTGYKTVNLCLPAAKAVPAGFIRPSRINWPEET
jgi:hypothetical protein